MRFFPHDPTALRRRGRILSAAGALFLGLLIVGLMLDGSWANLPFFLLSALGGLGLLGGGLVVLKDARAIDRERRVLGQRPVDVSAPAVAIRPRPAAVDPRPEVLPPFPTRRMIGVSVMFAGLIGPALLGAFQAVRFGPGGAFAGLLLLGLSSWMVYNLLSLWRGKLWAWSAGTVLFSFGAVIGAVMTAGSLLSGGFAALPLGAATLSYFACGLGALYSLKGKWFRHLEWKPAKDPLAGVDRKAVAAALRKRATS